MPEILPISIKELSTSFATRRRGAEAYQRLLPLLGNGPVVLDLEGVELMPASYLDGLILRLAEGGYASDVSFKASDPRTSDKLRRVSGLRGIDIFLYGPNGDREKLQPRYPVTLKAEYSEDIPE